MTRFRSVVLFAALIAVVGNSTAAQTAAALPQGARSPLNVIRIGVYDSRAVALAYYNSDPVRRQMQQMPSELKSSLERGDNAKAAELRVKGPAMQTLMHQQVFGCLSIPNIAPKLAPAFAAAARSKHLLAVVSKWEIGYRDPEVEYVDITGELVDVFQPNDQVRKWIADLLPNDPVPIENLLAMKPED